jgi:hypothetical protein
MLIEGQKLFNNEKPIENLSIELEEEKNKMRS